MSDNAELVEQITKVPSIAPKREKDPKRVATGKKLAESNKRMREEHAKYKASEEEQRRNDESRRALEAQRAPHETIETEYETETSGGLLSQLSLTNVISLVGIGLTVYTIFFKKSGNKGDSTRPSKHVAWKEPVEIVHHGGGTTEEARRIVNREEPEPKKKPVTKPRPKFGM